MGWVGSGIKCTVLKNLCTHHIYPWIACLSLWSWDRRRTALRLNKSLTVWQSFNVYMLLYLSQCCICHYYSYCHYWLYCNWQRLARLTWAAGLLSGRCHLAQAQEAVLAQASVGEQCSLAGLMTCLPPISLTHYHHFVIPEYTMLYLHFTSCTMWRFMKLWPSMDSGGNVSIFKVSAVPRLRSRVTCLGLCRADSAIWSCLRLYNATPTLIGRLGTKRPTTFFHAIMRSYNQPNLLHFVNKFVGLLVTNVDSLGLYMPWCTSLCALLRGPLKGDQSWTTMNTGKAINS